MNTRTTTRSASTKLSSFAPLLIALLVTVAGGAEAQQPASAPEVATEAAPSSEATAAFEEGRELWRTRRAANLQASLIPLQKAVELAPDWAPAHSALADSLALLGLYGAQPAAETLPLAAAAATRALSLDPKLGNAHASLGLTQYLFEHAYRDAEASFRKAISLDPDNHAAHHWLAMMLSALKRHGEALDLIDEAVRLAPSSVLLCNKRGTILGNAGLVNRARSQLLSCGAKHNNPSLTLREIAGLDIAEGLYEDAKSGLLKAQAKSPDDLRTLALLGYVAELTEDDDLGSEVQEVLAELSTERYVPVSTLLGVFTGRGELARAFRTLDEAIASREAGIIYLDTRPELAPLRDDPRYQRALTALGLPSKPDLPSK